MRIAIVNRSNRLAGGIERYLNHIIPGLRRRGCQVVFFCEIDAPTDRPLISGSADGPLLCTSKTGTDGALMALREWRPDITFGHGLNDSRTEGRLLEVAPAVFHAHEYYGTCISGRKSFRYPGIESCEKVFGPACLLNYFPRRCGGRSPVTMWRLYATQLARLESLRRCCSLITATEHMRREYLRHGFAPERVHTIPHPIVPREALRRASANPDAPARRSMLILLFAGRMELEKGGHVLIEALPSITRSLRRPVRLEMVGDGSARPSWEALGSRVCSQDRGIEIRFRGWLDGTQLDDAFDNAGLLVVPSLWPEPFGEVGGEAALRSLPSAAFAVGGIPEWLSDGVNGHLAPANPPNARGLAAAIVACVGDPEHHARLREGARALAGRYSVDDHAARLIDVFTDAISQPLTEASARAI